jgi:aminopeptidase N
MLLAQLEKDSEAFGRIMAAQALGKLNGSEVVTALEKVLKEDPFWAVRSEAARALGAIKSGQAEKAILDALENEKHAKVRRAIASVLGEFRDEKAAAALEKILNGDVTDLVEMAAAAALGKTRQPIAYESLTKALERSSFNEVLRSGVFHGFTELREERILPTILEWTTYGKPDQARYSATLTLGHLGKLFKDKEREQVTDRLLELLEDNGWRIRMAAISALQTLGEEKALGRLHRMAETAIDGREVRRSREAILAIRESKGREDEVKKLREDLEKLSTENRDLRDRLESLEQRLK